MSEMYKAYRAGGALDGACVLCGESALETFSLWKVITNKFPYDMLAAVHTMLIPLRHTTEAGLTDAERAELVTIKASYAQEYDYIIEATTRTKSIPQHFHLHLIKGKVIG